MRLRPRFLAFAGLALLGLAQSVSAAPVLGFTKLGGTTDHIEASVSGSTTTLTTAGVVGGNGLSSSRIIITEIGGAAAAIVAYLTFDSVTSVGAANGSIEQDFVGTVIVSSLAGGLGVNYLTAILSNAAAPGELEGDAGGSRALLGASTVAGDDVVFTSDVIAGGLAPPRDFNISISGITPALATTGAPPTVRGFTSTNFSGDYNAAIVPEPATVAMGLLGLPIGLLALRRRRAAR